MGFLDGALGGAVAGVGSLVGGVVGGLSSRASAKQNYEAQKEFAQNGIRWKVEDAKRAGIHPLYALGASTAQFSPSSSYGGDFGISDAFSQFGQGISRAAQAKQTQEERAQEQANADRAFQLQSSVVASQIDENNARASYYRAMAKDSEISLAAKASQLAIGQQALPPAMPSTAIRPDGTIVGSVMTGQNNASPVSLVKVNPSERSANVPGRPGTQASTVTDIAFSRTNDGGYAPNRSSDIANLLDDDFVGSILWHIRNSVPLLWDSDRLMPPKEWLPSGARTWFFDALRGAWYPDNDPHIIRYGWHPKLLTYRGRLTRGRISVSFPSRP